MSVLKFFARAAILTLLLSFAWQVRGQVHSSSAYRYLLDEKEMLGHLEFLASDTIAGRAAGSPQALAVAGYIAGKFESYGLKPFSGDEFLQHFKIAVSGKLSGRTVQGKNLDGYNVVGYIPAKEKFAPYIVVGAHFDHIGSFGEKFYPGADDNASGVASMLAIARALGKRYVEKNDFRHNIVFVAFDGNNHNLSGSRAFIQSSRIPSHRISFMVNLDQIGSTLAPVGEFDEYLLVLGADKLEPWQKGQLDFANDFFGLGLYLDYTYYGSSQFYNIFYRLSDQQTFTEKGIPALLFTSGITGHTNKESDVVENLSLDVLLRRTELVYRFLWLLD